MYPSKIFFLNTSIIDESLVEKISTGEVCGENWGGFYFYKLAPYQTEIVICKEAICRSRDMIDIFLTLRN